MLQIASFTLDSRVVLAPMAGVTDQPFRRLCRAHGAALTPSEMLTSNTALWHSEKNRLRRVHESEAEPRVVQIAGADPAMMAEAAQRNVEAGAQIIDINMGCPAKKVLKRAAGSALLRDKALVREILEAVVGAVEVPVTLKIRTGWSPEQRNGVAIARLAEDCGVQALAVHGRTRACMFRGTAEYDTIAAIKAAVDIPVFANGDIDSPEKAAHVLAYTGADAVMIGRAAQGRPWLFAEIDHYLRLGELPPPLPLSARASLLLEHVEALVAYYGEFKGARIARKHVGWAVQDLPGGEALRRRCNALEDPAAQLSAISDFFAATGATVPESAGKHHKVSERHKESKESKGLAA